MNPILIAIIAILAYVTAAILLAKPSASGNPRMVIVYAGLAIVLHIAFIALSVQHSVGFNFSFFSTASLISMIVALVITVATLRLPVEKLGIFLFPVTALMLGLDLYFPEQQRPLESHSWQMHTHILTSIIAFSLLNIAAVQAILLVIQNQQLKSHPPKRYIQSLPSLQSMESLLFQMIATGLLFLSVSLISGFIFIEDIFAQHLAHKTFFSIGAWLVFSGLLFGRLCYGWRGRTAIKWTLLGFLFLLLAYFGSKLVLEVILGK